MNLCKGGKTYKRQALSSSLYGMLCSNLYYAAVYSHPVSSTKIGEKASESYPRAVIDNRFQSRGMFGCMQRSRAESDFLCCLRAPCMLMTLNWFECVNNLCKKHDPLAPNADAPLRVFLWRAGYIHAVTWCSVCTL